MQPQGHLIDRPYVLGDILAGFTVATRHSAHQHARFVAQVDRKSVEFQFRRVFDPRILLAQPQLITHPRIERVGAGRFRVRLGSDREHRHDVTYRPERVERLAPHPLRRRIGRHEFRVCSLKRLQLAKQPVVLGIGNQRIVEDVIAMIVFLDLRAQFPQMI